MHAAIPMFAFAALLVSCAGLPASVTGGNYSCRTEEQGQQAAPYMVAVMPQAHGETLDISIDRRPSQTLSRVSGSPSSLFSNEVYAWQSSPAGTRLTDIGKVRTYACAVAPHAGVPHAGEASGTGAPIMGDADQRTRSRRARGSSQPH